jgi:hypothetical protein
VLIYPLFLVISGRAPTIVMTTLPPAPLSSQDAGWIARHAPVLIDVGRSFVARPAILEDLCPRRPASSPGAAASASSSRFITVVGVEFLINFGGLGQLINDLTERYDLPAMYATIGFVILVSVVFFMSLERIERWLRPGQ